MIFKKTLLAAVRVQARAAEPAEAAERRIQRHLDRDRLWLDGYEPVDLNLFYKGLPLWEFALLIRNVLDERYIEAADERAPTRGSARRQRRCSPS
ncbi:TonB-dependent receptor [Peristeroidobacter agariperforans]|uniref:TonB-dependent receptor n=1 Tax=Peristeroidobacter agariperforans TaxID=268404 RepID=UPI00101D5886|nr:TonB-dependent receptor [Peristeroidobacter agariperforans]